MPSSADAGPATPRHARPFVALFLAALVACPLAGVNAWPFSSWRLFSTLRTDRQTSWQASAVDSAGGERLDPIASALHGYRGFGRVMGRFARRSTGGRDAICGAWLQDAHTRFGPDVASLRIYHLRWLLSDRRGRRAAPPERTLAWTCTPRGARAAA